MSKFKQGDIVNQRYELLQFMGSGTYGEVWKVRDTVLDLDVAVKFYVSLDDKGKKEFIGEYKTAYGLHHPNLLTATHYDIWDDRPYLVMEFCERGASDKQAGHIDELSLWRFIHDVAAGLAYLHNLEPNPIIHQDIKPENVLISNNGDYVITDFGISMNMRSTMQKQSGRNENATGGAIAYMGPERFSANPMPIKASDIWSLGASIYEMATGELPFCGMGGGMQKNGAELPNLPDNWSAELNALMRACMAVNPWDRPLADDIARYTEARMKGQRPVPIWKSEGDIEIGGGDTGGADNGAGIGNVDERKRKNIKKAIVAAILLALVVSVIALIIPEPSDDSERYYSLYLADFDSCQASTKRGDASNYEDLLAAMRYRDSMDAHVSACYKVLDTIELEQAAQLRSTLSDKLIEASHSWSSAAMSQYELGDVEGAREFYEIALQLNDNNHVAALDELLLFEVVDTIAFEAEW